MVEFFDGTVLPMVLAFMSWAILIGAVIYIPFRRSPVAAQAWLLLFFFLPWAALVVYLAVGNAGTRSGGATGSRRSRTSSDAPSPT